jgi:aminodeoxyfutalosine deaminase
MKAAPMYSLRARYLFPVAAPPLADACVTIAAGRIVAVGREPQGDVIDLGNVAILPGLINAHTHLELSALVTPIGTAGRSLVEWLEAIIALRRTTTLDVAAGVRAGLAECHRCGTTLVGDIAQPGWPLEARANVSLRAVLFQELIAPTLARVPDAERLAAEHLDRLSRTPHAPREAGLSPHAPYSVHPELLARVVAMSREQHFPLAFHLAESAEEIELMHSGGGPLRALLDDLGAWQDGLLRPGTRPLDFLQCLAAADRTLVIHGNYLDDEEIAFLAGHAGRMSVVYCPRTQGRFNHRPYSLEKMLAAGVRVALGTDSRASSPDLSILAEMRTVAARHPRVPPPEVLRLGTLHAAAALGYDRDCGSIELGKRADLAVVALPDRDAADPHALLLEGDAPVVATYFHGELTNRETASGSPRI